MLSTQPPALLQVKRLGKQFPARGGLFSTRRPPRTAVEDVSFRIEKAQIYGLVGESGSGKSTLGRCILQLLRPDHGQVLFQGQDLCATSSRELRAVRQKLQIVFQDPLAALSPRRTIWQSLQEPLEQFEPGHRDAWRPRCEAVLEQVGLDREILPRLPQQLSSGQRQRVAFARAMLTRPELIIADEAVSALDVSVQAQILDLVKALRDEHCVAFMFISHDLAVIAQVADQVGVMFRGRIVESGTRAAVFGNPAHPYTRELLSAVPDPDPEVAFRPLRSGGLSRHAGVSGCVFAGRCPHVMDRCRLAQPPAVALEPGTTHRVECLLYE
jgi:oligopeptide/dipeptide ABC transporter ATP-binding protein